MTKSGLLYLRITGYMDTAQYHTIYIANDTDLVVTALSEPCTGSYLFQSKLDATHPEQHFS